MSIEIELRQVADLTPYARNARKHSEATVNRLVAIIEEMGWTNPILVDDDGIVAGHKRRLAASAIYAKGGAIRLPGGRELPAGTVPVIDVTGWTEAQRRAYILADNQTTLESEWDGEVLRLELSWLQGSGLDMDLTGFDGDALAKALEVGLAEAERPALKVKLADRFGVPPFSVLRAAEGWWQDRKRAWLALGIQSEIGRGDNLIKRSLHDMLSQVLHVHYSQVSDFIERHRAQGLSDDEILAAAHQEAGTRRGGKAKAKTYNDGAALGKGGLADQVAAAATARRKAKEAANG